MKQGSVTLLHIKTVPSIVARIPKQDHKTVWHFFILVVSPMMIDYLVLLAACFVSTARAFASQVGPAVVAEKGSRQIQQESDRRLRQKHDLVVFNRLFCGIPERTRPTPWKSSTELPTDFPAGALLRLGPNMDYPESAKAGFLDGDGMVTCITFPPDGKTGTCSFTYVDTRSRQLERLVDKKFQGTLGAVPNSWPMLGSLVSNMISFRTLQCQKDTCNTAIGVSGDRILCMMEQCPPCELIVCQDGSVSTVQTGCLVDEIGIANQPMTGGAISAHGRTNTNGERIHVSYAAALPPYLRVDIFDEGWKLKRSIPVNTPCPTMLHDCAVTDGYVVIFDFPLTLRVSRFLQNTFPVQYEPSYGARIGLLPIDSSTDKMLWFDVRPGVVLHAANAFERSGGTVVVHVLRSEPDMNKSYLEEYTSSFLYEYILDPSSQKVISEGYLNVEEIIEFPTINDNCVGKPVDHVYCNSVQSIGGPLEVYSMPQVAILLGGITKLSLKEKSKGQVLGKYALPHRFYGVSEPSVVPKTSGDGEYVVLVATFVPEGEKNWKDLPDERLFSRVIVLDGDSMEQVWSCDLPFHVNYGLHSAFVPWDKLKNN